MISLKNRYVILVAAVLMQMCLGATYAWSVFVGPLKTATGLDLGQVQYPFAIFYIVFPLTMLIAGVLVNKFSTRITATIGGLLFGGGWLLASMGKDHFLLTVLGIGVLGGVGVGFTYLIPIAVGVRWFPNHKGLVSGISMAGFGGGAAIIGQIAGRYMAHYSATPFDTFKLLGFAFLIIVTLGGTLMISPPSSSDTPRHEPLHWKTVIGRKLFWIFYLTLFAGIAAGFIINTNLTKLYRGPNLSVVLAAVSIFAIANAAGRISWGFIFDRVEAKTAICTNAILQSLLLFAHVWLLATPTGFLIFAFLIGFNYGGMLVIHASSSARYWGLVHVAQVYGWLSSANILASQVPVLAGKVYEKTGSFTLPILIAAIVLFISALIGLWQIIPEENAKRIE
jgi:OFA family oxalate/formate antiporter-like MFS transporter